MESGSEDLSSNTKFVKTIIDSISIKISAGFRVVIVGESVALGEIIRFQEDHLHKKKLENTQAQDNIEMPDSQITISKL